jgi:hypothetical protein
VSRHRGAAEVQRVVALKHSQLNPGAVLLIPLGLLLGPGYYLYCEHLSGRTTATLELDERADRWRLADGSIQRFRGGLAYRPVSLELHPERNDVRLALAFDMPADGNPAIDRYQATLFDVDHPLLQRELRIEARPGASASTKVGTLQAHTPGPHLFLLEELGTPGLTPLRVMLTVREEVERPLMPLVWTGIAMLLGGVGWTTYRLVPRAT